MTVLLLGDITGRSRVAVRMMTSVLEGCGHEVLALPTALISNTLNLGRHQALDTTDYLLRSLEAWEELGIGYDCLCIGYITGMAQARALSALADRALARGIPVLVDPILGDGGKMYVSVTEGQAEGMRMLCGHASLVTPNLTEAALLTGTPWEAARRGGNVLEDMVDALCGGVRSALVTSARTADGGHAVAGYDAAADERICIPYMPVHGQHGGTGDLFSALVIDGLLRGLPLAGAAEEASAAVAAQIAMGGGCLPDLRLK